MKRKPEPPPKDTNPSVGPLRHPALSGLKALRDKMEPAPEPSKPAPKVAREPQRHKSPAPDEPWRPNRDKELLAVAMSGVVPLGARHKARVRGPGAGAVDGATQLRRAHAQGSEPFEVIWHDDGSCEAFRAGRTFALEALGRLVVPQDDVDLHRLDAAEAHARVRDFVHSRRARGLRVVVIVHGAGKHSPDGKSLLRDVAVQALTQPPASLEIDAFRTADAANGGAGALLVALRPRSAGR